LLLDKNTGWRQFGEIEISFPFHPHSFRCQIGFCQGSDQHWREYNTAVDIIFASALNPRADSTFFLNILITGTWQQRRVL
jgi:hypothetical protein